MTSAKSPEALLTIGELADRLGVATHVLRYWEMRFAQLRPLQRAGQRRYYRPADVALATEIHRLLHIEGYTVAGAQAALKTRPAGPTSPAPAPNSGEIPPVTEHAARTVPPANVDIAALRQLRDRLQRALDRASAP